MREPSDLENLVITHPKILKLLSTGDRDPYFLCKQLGISYLFLFVMLVEQPVYQKRQLDQIRLI
jgi:hypothetical protein